MDVMSTNIVRGKIQFENKIKQNVKYPDTLEFLRQYFINHIGVMQVKESLSEELVKKGYMPRIEYFSAIRMAKACLEISNEKENYDTSLYILAIDRYLDTKYIKFDTEYNADNNQNDKINISLMVEITNANDNDIKELGDINNIINDVTEEELSIEGKRAVGYLPKDFDTLDPNKNETLLEVNKLPLAIITQDQKGNTILMCPNCYSDALYDNGYSRFVCIDCDNEFKSPLNLGDLNPDNEEE